MSDLSGGNQTGKSAIYYTTYVKFSCHVLIIYAINQTDSINNRGILKFNSHHSTFRTNVVKRIRKYQNKKLVLIPTFSRLNLSENIYNMG